MFTFFQILEDGPTIPIPEPHQPPPPQISVAVGIIVGLLASFVQSLGLTIQRKSHMQNEACDPQKRRSEIRRPLWILGFVIFIVSNLLGTVFQIGALPIVVLAPLGAVSLLWNAFFAKILLGDVFSRYLIIGTILIAGGAVLIAIFGVVPEPNHTLDELIRLYSRPAFIAWFSVICFVIVVVLVAAHIIEWSLDRRVRSSTHSLVMVESPFSPTSGRRPSGSPITANDNDSVAEGFGSGGGRKSSGNGYYQSMDIDSDQSDPKAIHKVPFQTPTTDELADFRTPLLSTTNTNAARPGSPTPSSRPSLSLALSSNDQSSPNISTKTIAQTRLLLGIAYGSASGTLSGMCLLFAKTGTELLILTIMLGKNQFVHWQSWAIVLALLAVALLQLWYLNRSLRLVGPTLICPLAFCFYNLSSILNGLVYYDQWKELSPSSIGLVSVGIVVLLAGVWIVSIQSSEGEGEDGMGGKADVDVGKGVQVDEESRLLGGEDEGFDSVDEEEGDEHRGNVGRYMRQDGTDGDIEEDDAEEKRRSAFKDKLGEVYKVLMTGMDEVSSILANGSVSHRRGSGGEGSKKVGAGAGAGALRGFSIGIAASSPGFAIRPRRQTNQSIRPERVSSSRRSGSAFSQHSSSSRTPHFSKTGKNRRSLSLSVDDLPSTSPPLVSSPLPSSVTADAALGHAKYPSSPSLPSHSPLSAPAPLPTFDPDPRLDPTIDLAGRPIPRSGRRRSHPRSMSEADLLEGIAGLDDGEDGLGPDGDVLSASAARLSETANLSPRKRRILKEREDAIRERERVSRQAARRRQRWHEFSLAGDPYVGGGSDVGSSILGGGDGDDGPSHSLSTSPTADMELGRGRSSSEPLGGSGERDPNNSQGRERVVGDDDGAEGVRESDGGERISPKERVKKTVRWLIGRRQTNDTEEG